MNTRTETTILNSGDQVTIEDQGDRHMVYLTTMNPDTGNTIEQVLMDTPFESSARRMYAQLKGSRT